MLSALFYRFDIKWLSDRSQVKWNEIQLIVFLNHTSLFEPLFIRVAPNKFIWRLSKRLVAPGADITLNRPIAGRIYKAIAPGITAISRKRDQTWSQFMQSIDPKSVIAILPEGRMKRKDGLDKHGKPMDVRGGIADILRNIQGGKALFVYSGGLHHVQTPGQKLPKLFKSIKVNLEEVSIDHYKEQLMVKAENFKAFKTNVINDLNKKLREKVPTNDSGKGSLK